MNRTWKYLMIIAIATFIIYVGTEIYGSVTGRNAKFTKVVTPISSDLGADVIEVMGKKNKGILIFDETLDNK